VEVPSLLKSRGDRGIGFDQIGKLIEGDDDAFLGLVCQVGEEGIPFREGIGFEKPVMKMLRQHFRELLELQRFSLFPGQEAEAPADEAAAGGRDDRAAEKKKEKKKGRKGAAEGEEDEEAGVLFARDIYSGNKSARKKADEDRDGDEEDGAEEPSELVADTEVEEPAPARGGKAKKSPGFAAPEAAEETAEKTRAGSSLLESRLREVRDSLSQQVEKREENRKKRKQDLQHTQEEQEAEEAKERDEKLRRRKKEAPEDMAGESRASDQINLEALAYSISLEDLHRQLGISLVREDHVKLTRRWDQKKRDNSIRLLLEDPKTAEHPYALIPRLTRFVKDGQVVQITTLNLLRHFYQLFENVHQVVQFKTEPFFVRETPTLEWAIVACEALPETLGKNYLEQRPIFSQYIQKYMSNERRVRRRTLVEALYDLVILNLIAKEPILRKTVDLTESRLGRQGMLCINFGKKGIRISSVPKDQGHPQLGMCPSW